MADLSFGGGFGFENFGFENLERFLNPKSNVTTPLLGQVAPPRKTVRNQKPFDFFGTLFTTPGTQDLNPLALLNSTI